MGISIWRGGSCLDVDDAWCLLWNCTREEARLGGWIERVHPDDRELAISLIFAQTRDRESRIFDQLTGMIRRHVSDAPEKGAGDRNSLIRCTSIAVNVAGAEPVVIRIDEQESAIPRGHVAAATEAAGPGVDEWASAFAHGINNPLAVIDSEVGLLLDVLGRGGELSSVLSKGGLEDTAREIRRQIRRCTRATAALQSVFRRRTARSEVVPVGALMARFGRDWPDRSNMAGVRLGVLLVDEALEIETDPWLLEQALMTAVGLVLEVCTQCLPVRIHVGGLGTSGEVSIRVQAGLRADEVGNARDVTDAEEIRVRLDNSGKAIVEAMRAFAGRLGGRWSIDGRHGVWAEVVLVLPDRLSREGRGESDL